MTLEICFFAGVFIVFAVGVTWIVYSGTSKSELEKEAKARANERWLKEEKLKMKWEILAHMKTGEIVRTAIFEPSIQGGCCVSSKDMADRHAYEIVKGARILNANNVRYPKSQVISVEVRKAV